MLKKMFCLALVLMLGQAAHASLHTFNLGTYVSGTPLSITGPVDIDITHADPNNPIFTGFIDHYNITNQLPTFSVVANGNTFTAVEALVADSQVSIMLKAPNVTPFMDMVFVPLSGPLPHGLDNPNPGDLVFPQMGPVGSSSPIYASNFQWHLSDNSLSGVYSGTSLTLAAVPEPSSFVLGGLATGIVGVGRLMRRRRAA